MKKLFQLIAAVLVFGWASLAFGQQAVCPFGSVSVAPLQGFQQNPPLVQQNACVDVVTGILNFPSLGNVLVGGVLVGLRSVAASDTFGANPNIDLSSWNVAMARFGETDATANANAFLITGHIKINPTGSNSNYEKGAAFFRCLHNDTTAISANRDCVGFDGLGEIAAGNTNGRVWGGVSRCQVDSTGDGACRGLEIDVTNNSTAQPLPDQPNSKYGLQIVDFGSSITTAGIIFDANSQGFQRGIVLRKIVSGGVPISYESTGSPSCSSTVTGVGATCAMSANSNDLWGSLVITTGAGPGSSGAATLTFSQTLGVNPPVCIFTYLNGTAAWSQSAFAITVTGNSTSSQTVSWNNNGVALTGASIYAINYQCQARP